jgi:hypothetical protein
MGIFLYPLRSRFEFQQCGMRKLFSFLQNVHCNRNNHLSPGRKVFLRICHFVIIINLNIFGRDRRSLRRRPSTHLAFFRTKTIRNKCQTITLSISIFHLSLSPFLASRPLPISYFTPFSLHLPFLSLFSAKRQCPETIVHSV